MLDRFQFELADMTIDAQQRPFKLLNAIAGLTEDMVQLIGWQG